MSGETLPLLIVFASGTTMLFYVHCDFSESPLDSMTMMISISEAQRIISGK